MTYRWQITIEAWPHSTGKGQTVDQAAAGERAQLYEANAHDMKQALIYAEHIVRGIEANPMVWQAPIMSIVRVRE
jgi:hypothetical protein